MSAKKWLIIFFTSLITILVCIGAFTAWLDPFFHYHAPLEGYYYNLDNERYQNDGIMKNFTYDAVITGTSMAENFKTSDMDRLFMTDSIKVPYSGGSFCEISRGLERALDTHEVGFVVRPLDYSLLSGDKDYIDKKYNSEYLSDDLFINDIKYLLNKDVLVKYCYPMLKEKSAGNPGGHTSFDEYVNWMPVFEDMEHPKPLEDIEAKEEEELTGEEREKLKGNITQNILDQAKRHPDTEFYLFFPPYSIVSWQRSFTEGTVKKQLEKEEETIKLLIDCPNIKLFSFNDEPGLITDLENYSDETHYVEDVNTRILEWMNDGKHCITPDNYIQYIEWERRFFLTYDYYDI